VQRSAERLVRLPPVSPPPSFQVRATEAGGAPGGLFDTREVGGRGPGTGLRPRPAGWWGRRCGARTERSALPADAAAAPGARGRDGQSSVFPGLSRGPWAQTPFPPARVDRESPQGGLCRAPRAPRSAQEVRSCPGRLRSTMLAGAHGVNGGGWVRPPPLRRGCRSVRDWAERVSKPRAGGSAQAWHGAPPASQERTG
jgi:hypothetical protein